MNEQFDLLDEHEMQLEPVNGFNFIPLVIFGAVYLTGWGIKFLSPELGAAVAAIGFGAVSGFIWANVFYKSKRNTLVVILTVLTGIWFLYKGGTAVFMFYLLQSIESASAESSYMGGMSMFTIFGPLLYYAGFFITLAAFVITYNREVKLKEKTRSSHSVEEYPSTEEW